MCTQPRSMAAFCAQRKNTSTIFYDVESFEP